MTPEDLASEQVELLIAACTIADWHFFLPADHSPEQPSMEPYRIFEPRWREVILLWLGREDVEQEKKEQFIEALVNFEDGCGQWNLEQVDRGFYQYQAYFLAAAGIGEFQSCSLTDEIVPQIVKWAFGDFNVEKQQWQTVFYPLENRARETLSATDRARVIQALGDRLQQPQCPEDTCILVAKSLGTIGQGNGEAIATLVQLLANTDNIDIRFLAAQSLQEIGQGNVELIATLAKILRETDNKRTRISVAKTLGKIDQGTVQAISTLVEIVRDTNDNLTCIMVVSGLGEIALGNTEAITVVAEVLKNANHRLVRRAAARSLQKIGQGNQEAIAALIQILRDTEDEDTRLLAAKSLEEIDPGNPQVIPALVQLLAGTEDEYMRFDVTTSLGKIDPGNPQVISASVQLLTNTEDEYVRWEVAYLL